MQFNFFTLDKVLNDIVFCLIDLKLSAIQDLHGLQVSNIDRGLEVIALLVQFLKLSRGRHFLDLVASCEQELSFEHRQVKVDLSRTLHVVCLNFQAQEVVDAALDNLLVPVALFRDGPPLRITNCPLDLV